MNTWLNLKDNVIIVTGGASGIGLDCVIHYPEAS